MLIAVEHFTTWLSGIIWPLFLPFLLIVSIYASYKTVFVVRPLLKVETVKFKNFVGPVAIALSAMIGCGATVGVLKGLSKVVSHGQVYFEALPVWSIIGSLFLIPLAYSETIVAKISNSTPKEYLARTIHPLAGSVFALAFLIAYVFGFGGIQFSGVDTAINVIIYNSFGTTFSVTERYMYIVLPLLGFVMAIVITKMHSLFINTLAFLISFATFSYTIFFMVFIAYTVDFLPIFFGRMWLGLCDPISMIGVIPVAVVIGRQRTIQTAETGLGALGMASLEAGSKPREAGIITLVPAVITVFIAIVVTTYIASYGIYNGIFSFETHTSAIDRLGGYIATATTVTGYFGLTVMLLFIILSGASTILASYYFLGKLTSVSENVRIVIYFIFMGCAGTLAIFGFTIVFDVLDLMMFVLTALNVIGISIFVTSHYQKHLNKNEGNI